VPLAAACGSTNTAAPAGAADHPDFHR